MTDLNSAQAAEVGACPVCRHYLARRFHVLPIAVVHHADQVGVDPKALLSRYMWSVHQRHLAGGCLSTRPRTPDEKTETGTRLRVKRYCNGCASDLGDVREDELAAAVAGSPLPDVTRECGCAGRDAA
jgi:hypothetical protein